MVLSGNNGEEASHCSRCERIRSPGSQQARYKDNDPDVIDAASRTPVRRWFADSHQTSLHVRRPTHNILDWRSGVCLAVWSLLADEWGASKSPCLFHYLWGEGKDGDHIRKGDQGEGKIHETDGDIQSDDTCDDDCRDIEVAVLLSISCAPEVRCAHRSVVGI